jgi:hypothetical protein
MEPASGDLAATAGASGAERTVPASSRAPAAIQELQAILARAKAGAVEALPEVRRAFDQHPEVWQRYADLSTQVERRWIALLAGSNVCLAESLARKAAALRAELAHDTDPLAAKLVIDRIVTSWLEVHYFEAAATMVGADVAYRQAAHMQARLSAAQRRHLAAVKALTEVRRLATGNAARPKRRARVEQGTSPSRPAGR